MPQTREAITQNLAERLHWEAARRDDSRIARRLYRKQVIDGVYRLDEGAVLDEFFHFLRDVGVLELMAQVEGKAIEREMVPYVQYALLYGLKTLLGVESMHALPALLLSDEALMRLVGFNAHQVRHGVCQRGAAKRQGLRRAGPICPETLAHNIVKLNLRDLEALFNGSIRALAIEVTVYGWKLLVLIDARTKIPLAVKVVKISDHETLWLRAMVTQAQSNLTGSTSLHKVLFDKGFLDGPDLWWLDQRGLTFVVPAKTSIAVTVDARAQAAAGEGITMGRRVHTACHGQGRAAWTERLETEVVSITGLTTYDQYGTPEHGRQANRRNFQANPLNAVVVRKWQGKDYGPGGKTVFLTNAPVDKPLQPFDDYDDRSLIENCCIKEAKQQWGLGHPPQKTERAVRVHVVFTLLMFALATAYRLQCEREATGGEFIGWQRWRRQLLEQTREKIIVFAQRCYGIFHVAEYSMLLGLKLKKRPPGVGTSRDILTKYGLATDG